MKFSVKYFEVWYVLFINVNGWFIYGKYFLEDYFIGLYVVFFCGVFCCFDIFGGYLFDWNLFLILINNKMYIIMKYI